MARPTRTWTSSKPSLRATPAQVQAASREWLQTFHYTMTVRPYPTVTPGRTSTDRKVLPPLGDAPEVQFPEVQRTTLSNGLKVMLLERHATPIVNVTLAVDAGYAADPAGKAGLASLTLGLMDDGTTSRDTFRISDELDALGARLSTSSSLDLSFVRLNALAATLVPSLTVMADVVRNPAFPADCSRSSRSGAVAQSARRRRNRSARPSARCRGCSMARGMPMPTRSPGPATRRAWRRSRGPISSRGTAPGSSPTGNTLIVTGDVTMAALKPALEAAFGAWPKGTPPSKSIKTVAAPAGGRVYLIDKPDATQSVIMAGHVTEPGGAPADLAIDTVMRNFGGIATSRLNRNLRLDKHWSYGVQGALPASRGPRPFYVLAPVQTDKTKESMVEIAKELRDVAGERPVAGEEFASIMRNQTLGLPGRFETLDAIESAAVQLVNLGYPDEYFSQYATRVRALDEAALDAASRQYIHPNEIIWLVVGDLAKVEAGIRDLKFGEVIRLDAH